MTKPLTERQQLARLKKAVDHMEQAANAMHGVSELWLDDMRLALLRDAKTLKSYHDARGRAMEARDD